MKRSAKLLVWSIIIGLVALAAGITSVATNHLVGVTFVVFLAACSMFFYFWSNSEEARENKAC